MNGSAPRRPLRQSTKELIIEVAERLWGDHGLDAVSLRQISAEAGLSNPVSVQYHFGDRDGLIRAIFDYRLPGFELRRRELLEDAKAAGKENDLRTLLHILTAPVFEQIDYRGIPTYAAFWRQIAQSESVSHIRELIMDTTPAFKEARDRLANAATGVPPALVLNRLQFLHISIIEQMVQASRNLTEGKEPIAPLEILYEDLIDSIADGLAHVPSMHVKSAIARRKRARSEA